MVVVSKECEQSVALQWRQWRPMSECERPRTSHYTVLLYLVLKSVQRVDGFGHFPFWRHSQSIRQKTILLLLLRGRCVPLPFCSLIVCIRPLALSVWYVTFPSASSLMPLPASSLLVRVP